MRALARVACLGVVLGASGATAEAIEVVRVQGSATRIVPPDTARIEFAYGTERGSFTAAYAEAHDLLLRMAGVLPQSCSLEITNHRIDLLKQKRIAWHTKGKKLEHRFDIACSVTGESLHQVVASAVDAILPIDRNLTVSQIDAGLSAEAQSRLAAQLISEAAGNALRLAEAAADGAKGHIGHLRGIAVAPSADLGSKPRRLAVAYDSIQRLTKARSPIRVRDEFTLASALSPEIVYTITLDAEFELTPPY